MPRKKGPDGKEIRNQPRTLANGAKSRSNVALAVNGEAYIDPIKQATTGQYPLAYVFTLFDYTEEDIIHLESMVHEDPQVISYLDFGLEKTQEGRPHLQGQLEVNEPSMHFFHFLKSNFTSGSQISLPGLYFQEVNFHFRKSNFTSRSLS